MEILLNWNLRNGNMKSSVNKFILNLIGSYFIFTAISCILLNLLLLLVFKRNKHLRTPFNILIMVMTSFNLFGVIQFPLVIHSSFTQTWIWSKLGCIFSGFIIYFVGCLQIYLMTFISYFRFRILKKPLNEKRINRRAILKSCLFCVFLSLFWSSAPLLGWSYYSLEDSLVSCSVEYNEKSFNVTSYNI